jgi:shikimate dehydrogenase
MKSPAKVYGLLGCPLAHSFSPLMHNAAFSKLGIPGCYLLFEKQPEEVAPFLRSLEDENIWGLNITVPYKEKVLELDFVEPDKTAFYAKDIQAVNTLVRKDGSLKGFNTDVAGFLRHLNKLDFDPLNKKAALLGAGGAGKAVAYALAKRGVRQLAVFDLDQHRSESIRDVLRELFPELDTAIAGDPLQLKLADKNLLVNATPVGLKADDPSPVDEDLLHDDLFVYDLIYNPSPTKLLALAKERGLSCSDGLGMLVYQAAFSFIYFTGTHTPYAKIVEVMWKAVEEALGR